MLHKQWRKISCFQCRFTRQSQDNEQFSDGEDPCLSPQSCPPPPTEHEDAAATRPPGARPGPGLSPGCPRLRPRGGLLHRFPRVPRAPHEQGGGPTAAAQLAGVSLLRFLDGGDHTPPPQKKIPFSRTLYTPLIHTQNNLFSANPSTTNNPFLRLILRTLPLLYHILGTPLPPPSRGHSILIFRICTHRSILSRKQTHTSHLYNEHSQPCMIFKEEYCF